jgi:leucyl/phenylalanyl-tRNA--protein transferase
MTQITAKITAQTLINAYAQGIFPMAESATDQNIFWVDPDMRGIFPLEAFHVSKKLAKTIKKQEFEIKIDNDFDRTIRACAKTVPEKGRRETWINEDILKLYRELFDHDLVHTVECWQDNQLVGGLYGVCINGVFCGESMFHTVTDASKVALTYLVARLNYGKFSLLDTQFLTPHLTSLGAVEITRTEYHIKLEKALLNLNADFHSMPAGLGTETILQLVTQTS